MIGIINSSHAGSNLLNAFLSGSPDLEPKIARNGNTANMCNSVYPENCIVKTDIDFIKGGPEVLLKYIVNNKDVKYLWTVRHPRSWFLAHLIDSHRYHLTGTDHIKSQHPKTIIDMKHKWYKFYKLVFEDYNERQRQVKLENLLENPEKELSSICEFLGVSYDPSMLDFHKHQQHKNYKATYATLDKSRANLHLNYKEKYKDYLQYIDYDLEPHLKTMDQYTKILGYE